MLEHPWSLNLRFIFFFFPSPSTLRVTNTSSRDSADIRLPASSHLSDFRTVQKHSSTLCRGTTPPLSAADPWRSSILLFSSYRPSSRHPLFLLSWTPMETVASWHGEVNYKRYQSLGVVGWLVGLGSTDSQLPLRADPRARAIPSSPALFLPLYHLVQLFLSHSQRSASFPPSSILRPHLTSVTNQGGLTP